VASVAYSVVQSAESPRQANVPDITIYSYFQTFPDVFLGLHPWSAAKHIMSSIAKWWSDMTHQLCCGADHIDRFCCNVLSRSADINMFTQLRDVSCKVHIKCSDIYSRF